jgi:ATP-dependent Clp protease ATP-binding subunit ClpC
VDDRLTDRARRVLQLAGRAAFFRGYGQIGTEHLLLGLLEEGSGVAVNALLNLDVPLRRFRRQVEQVILPKANEPPDADLSRTAAVQRVLERAAAEARGLHHNYVGTEHLLLGLLHEQEGLTAWLLTVLGLQPEAVRQEVRRLLGTP